MTADGSQVCTGKRKHVYDEDEGKERVVKRRTENTAPAPTMIRPTLLHIITDSTTLQKLAEATAYAESMFSTPEEYTPYSDEDSLFGPSSEAPSLEGDVDEPPSGMAHLSSLTGLNSPNGRAAAVAIRSAPPIPGLFFDPTLRLSNDLAEEVMLTCMQMYFRSPDVDQVMLFERARERSSGSGLPSILNTLLSSLSTLLRPFLPPEKHALLFPPSPTSYARQAILNLYWPGDGITPHVDLLDRYGDGIIGVSFGSGCVMRFAKVLNGRGDEPASQRAEEIASGEAEGCGVYLPPGSVIVMTEEARYGWTHGIEKCMEDLVESESEAGSPAILARDVRLSATFRWLLPGADVVGGTGSHKPNSAEVSS